MFKVGDKIICIDVPGKSRERHPYFKVGEIFTVQGFANDGDIPYIKTRDGINLLVGGYQYWPTKHFKIYNEISVNTEQDYYKWLAARNN